MKHPSYLITTINRLISSFMASIKHKYIGRMKLWFCKSPQIDFVRKKTTNHQENWVSRCKNTWGQNTSSVCFLHPRTIVFLSFPIQFTCKHRTHKHTHRFYLFSQWDRFLMLLLVSTTDLFTCVFRAVRCCPNIYWCCSCFNCPFIRFCKPLLTVECWARSRFWLSIIVELNCPQRGNNKYCYCSNALLSSVSVDSVSLKWINEHHKLILHLYLMSFSLLYIPPIYFE